MDTVYAKKIKKQIRVYDITKQQDDHEKNVHEIDLSDPDALFEIIKKGAIEYGFAEELTRMLQNLVLIPNHQRSLRKHVWSNCNKAINVVCNPLREQYLIDAEKEQEQEQKEKNENGDKAVPLKPAVPTDTVTTKKEESKSNEDDEFDDDGSVYRDIDSDDEILDFVPEEEEEEDDEEALYKERLIELPFVLDVGLEDKDGFEFFVADPFMKLTMEERKKLETTKDTKLNEKWTKCCFVFTNLSNKKKLTFELDKARNLLTVSYTEEQTVTVSLKGKGHSTLNLDDSSTTKSSTTQPVSRRQSQKQISQADLDQAMAASNIIGDHITFAVSTKGINFFWEEKRSASYDINFNVSHSWLIEFVPVDKYAMINQAQFYSCSLLKQFPTFMELNLFLTKLPDFQDTEQELENKLKETEEQVTMYSEMAENRRKKLEEAAATAKTLHENFIKMKKRAAQMNQDIALIKQVAPKAFERVVAYQKGIKLEPEKDNVLLVEKSDKSPTSSNGMLYKHIYKYKFWIIYIL